MPRPGMAWRRPPDRGSVFVSSVVVLCQRAAAQQHEAGQCDGCRRRARAVLSGMVASVGADAGRGPARRDREFSTTIRKARPPRSRRGAARGAPAPPRWRRRASPDGGLVVGHGLGAQVELLRAFAAVWPCASRRNTSNSRALSEARRSLVGGALRSQQLGRQLGREVAPPGVQSAHALPAARARSTSG